MNDRQKMFGEEKISKLLLKFSLPAIAGMLISALYNVVDRIFIGQKVGSYAISGVGLTFPLMAIIIAFGLLFGIGGSTLISIKLGEKKFDEAEKILGNILTLLVIAGLFLAFIGLTMMTPILNFLGASNETLVYAKKYITIIYAGSITAMLGFSLNHSIRSDGNPRLAMMSNVIGAVTNVIFDYFFVMVFEWGVEGAAYATLIGQSLTAIWVLYYFTKGNSHLKLKKKNLILALPLVKAIVAIGISSFVIQFTGSIAGAVANVALKKTGGDLAIGAMAITMSAIMFFFMPVIGLRQGVQPIIGFNYGAKQFKRVREAFYLGSIVSTLISLLGFFIMEFFPEVIIGLFSKSPDIINLGKSGIRIIILMMGTIGFQIMVTTFYQAIGDTKMSLILSMLRQALLLIPLLIILPPIFGVIGVWISYPLADGIAFIISFYLINKKFKELENQKNAFQN